MVSGDMATVKKTVTIGQLPNGATLFVEFNEVGGRRYWSDEIGGGVCVWDTSLVDSGTLLAAMAEERTWEFLNAQTQKGYASEKVQKIPAKAKPMGPKRLPGRPPGRPSNGTMISSPPIQRAFAEAAAEQQANFQNYDPDAPVMPSQQITDDLVEELQELSEEDELPPPPLEDYEIWEPRLKMFYRDKMWSPTWGARPGQEGCEAPPDLIEEVRTGRPRR